jgi:hypothetical protein
MMRPFSACQWKLSASQKTLMAISWPGVRRLRHQDGSLPFERLPEW